MNRNQYAMTTGNVNIWPQFISFSMPVVCIAHIPKILHKHFRKILQVSSK